MKKKLVYFVELEEGFWAYMGEFEQIQNHLKDNLEDDDTARIKAKWLTQDEIDAIPEGEP